MSSLSVLVFVTNKKGKCYTQSDDSQMVLWFYFSAHPEASDLLLYIGQSSPQQSDY